MKRYRINLQINKNKVYECFYVKSNHSRTIIDFLNSNQPRYFLFLDSFNFLGNFCFHYYFSSVLFLSLPFVYRSKLERPNVTLKYFASQITLSYCFVNIINVHTRYGVQSTISEYSKAFYTYSYNSLNGISRNLPIIVEHIIYFKYFAIFY